MALRAILLDVDGTLADTESLGHLPAYNRAFREVGLPWYWSAAFYRELLLLSTGRERLHHFLQRYAPSLGNLGKAAQRDPVDLVDEVHAAKSRHFNDLVEQGHVPLRSGVRRLMNEALDEGVAIAIVTNATRATLMPLLRHTLGKDLSERLTVLVGGDDVTNRKPAPDLYINALRLLDLDAAECVAIEDSAMGLEAALAAGVVTLVTVNCNTRDQQFVGASLVVSDLGEPEQPFSLLAGNAGDHEWVTVPLLRELCAAASPNVSHSHA